MEVIKVPVPEDYTLLIKAPRFAALNIQKLFKKFIEDQEGIKLIRNVFRNNPGVPDYKYIDKEGKTVYMELKGKDEGIRMSQLRWLHNHPTKKVRIMAADIIREDIPFGEREHPYILFGERNERNKN